MASDRVKSFSAAHCSTAKRKFSLSLIAVTGSRPVAGRPRPRFFFGITFIDFMTNLVLHKLEAEKISTRRPDMTTDNSPSRSLVIAEGSSLPATLGPELEEAADYARAEKSEATRRAYRSDFDLFRSWCETKRVPALPATAQSVAAFLAAEANRGVKPSTIGRRLAAICYAHKLAGHEPPTNSEAVKATLRGIRRTAGTAPARKAPATADRIVAMVDKAGADIKGLRDRALLLLGLAPCSARCTGYSCALGTPAAPACRAPDWRARNRRRGGACEDGP